MSYEIRSRLPPPHISLVLPGLYVSAAAASASRDKIGCCARYAPSSRSPASPELIDGATHASSKFPAEHAAPAERPTAYATAIRSTEGETGETAHKAAEVYARIPFYIPGTNEIGEFYVEPRVTDKGEMTFQFRFTDPDSAAEKIRLQVDLSPAEIAEIQTGLVRIQRWSDTAHRNKLRKFFEKRAACVPAADCPPDGETLNDRSSTEIRFQVTDEGMLIGVQN